MITHINMGEIKLARRYRGINVTILTFNISFFQFLL